jgi:hypothetical protein
MKRKIEKITEEDIKKARFNYSFGEQHKKAIQLGSYLGKQVKTAFITDPDTPEYLIGLEMTNILGTLTWNAHIMFWINGYVDKKWIDVRAVEPLKNEN